jgi:serine phosphatase RsbU (regulator of sigma subunit)
MDDAAKKYARRILLIHLLVFVFLIAFVIFAAKEVYDRTKREVIARTTARQTVLLNQAARGIESFYQVLIDDIDLLQRVENAGSSATTIDPAGQLETSSLLWRQLQGRAARVFVYEKASHQTRELFATPDAIPIDQIIPAMGSWIQSQQQPSVSSFQRFGERGVTLVYVPDAKGSNAIDAVVPISAIDQRFMHEVNKQSAIGLTLVDETLATMATSNEAMIGMNLLTIPDATVQAAVTQIITAGKPATMQLDRKIVVQGVTLRPAIISAEPISLPGKTWWVYIATAMSEIDGDILIVFKRAIIWAGIAIVGLTGVLFSTAVVLIRERIRTERMQHDMLRRELDQARDIQIAWLPETHDAPEPRAIELAAVNVPASHISGDFYNWFELPDKRTVVVIGDVTGHGMAAAFLMATTQLLVRTTMPRFSEPGKCLEEVNRQLCVQVFNGQFVTMLLMVLDLEQGVASIASAGHPSPLASSGRDYQEWSVAPELVMGIEKEIAYPTVTFALKEQTNILLYTDGLPDAQAPNGDRLELDGIKQSLVGPHSSAQELLSATVQAVDQFRGPRALNDDLTLVAIHIARLSAPPTSAAAAGGMPGIVSPS